MTGLTELLVTNGANLRSVYTSLRSTKMSYKSTQQADQTRIHATFEYGVKRMEQSYYLCFIKAHHHDALTAVLLRSLAERSSFRSESPYIMI
jgi:hypothetical protein